MDSDSQVKFLKRALKDIVRVDTSVDIPHQMFGMIKAMAIKALKTVDPKYKPPKELVHPIVIINDEKKDL